MSDDMKFGIAFLTMASVVVLVIIASALGSGDPEKMHKPLILAMAYVAGVLVYVVSSLLIFPSEDKKDGSNQPE